MSAFITSMGVFLPGEPIDNETMEAFVGKIAGKSSRARARVLRQNGIQTRYYAIDREQKTLFSNAEMAAQAVRQTAERVGLAMKDIDFLAAATSQGDFPLPGFASMVHGEIKVPPCEIATLHGVCASGVMALKSAMLQVVSGGKEHAIACASEFASRLLKASRFERQRRVLTKGLDFDTEFLRWMLSDGAGAALVERSPRLSSLGFKIEWIDLKSFANQFGPCMYVGPEKNGKRLRSWLDYASYDEAADDGAINLRQDIRMLPDVVRYAINGLLQTAQSRALDPSKVDWLAIHYSSHLFRDQSYELAAKAGLDFPRERWFTNLYSKGNLGSASIFVLLEELLTSGKLRPGQNILCVVPESGRFLFGYMLLKVVEGSCAGRPERPAALALSTEPPQLKASSDSLAQALVRQLAGVWFEFEERLRRTPIIAKLYDGNLTVEDYRSLLFNLRQQVIEGSRWISRAASSITPQYFPIRSAFIAHAGDEHRDFEMIERNYTAVGGNLEDIRKGSKNIGSEALSAYVLHKAEQENPFALFGTMFIVEGLGQRVAREWGERIRDQLGLDNEAVSFFLYHSESDIEHFQRLDQVIAAGILTEKLVAEIIKCAKVTARLYVLQLEEMGNF